MEYERIEKPFSSPQVGGFSPRKLRSMLLGVEKKRKEEEEEFKDVSMVSSGPDPHNVPLSAARSPEDDDTAALAAFEFHKAAAADRAPHRPPFSKPAPSKWDNAHKWLASPNAGRIMRGKKERGSSNGGSGRSIATKVVVVEDVDTKREIVKDSCAVAECCAKSAANSENFVTESAVSFSQHDSLVSVESDTAVLRPPSTVRSVSMRDMGTEMTPIASQEPSRTGTPARATTPIRSPSSSRPSTPRGSVSGSVGEVNNGRELSEKELQMKTRREIMILGTQLGKANIAAWASKEEEHAASASIQNLPVDQLASNDIQIRAIAWEEAEKAKYMARFKQEEIKIQAWENHQKAKTEAEMRKIEVEVERMKARAQEKLAEKLAATRRKAEEKRVAAETKREQHSARTAQQVEYIRKTGHIPSPFSCWGFCSW